MRFQGKAVLVTGGASGQGREACRLFAAEGAKVVVADWDGPGAEVVAAELGGAAFTVDVAREREVKALVEFTNRTYGGPDVLFCNAGVGFSATGRFKMASVVDTPEEAWDGILAINLKGVAMCCKHAIPLMVQHGGGAIVNNASINAIVGTTGADAYTASKGGIVALTRVLALDWGRKNIRVNCICPGPVETPMIGELLKEPSFRGHFESICPMGRVGRADEVARVAVFLASGDASFINGAIIPVDGGIAAS
jgi:meso-butanediol dehydrogenase / (S,S)-butanediol dehydrogenase / diacetyl reductase